MIQTHRHDEDEMCFSRVSERVRGQKSSGTQAKYRWFTYRNPSASSVRVNKRKSRKLSSYNQYELFPGISFLTAILKLISEDQWRFYAVVLPLLQLGYCTTTNTTLSIIFSLINPLTPNDL
jgi:hypothetical protein